VKNVGELGEVKKLCSLSWDPEAVRGLGDVEGRLGSGRWEEGFVFESQDGLDDGVSGRSPSEALCGLCGVGGVGGVPVGGIKLRILLGLWSKLA